jgi:hypothetical protein
MIQVKKEGIGRAYSMHEEKTNVYQVLVGKLEGKETTRMIQT